MFRLLNHPRLSKAISSGLFVVLLFNNLIFPARAFALTSGPTQPEFSSFDSVNASEMVNLFTGDFSYNIPLMDVDGYPINIAYHASPGMEQEASWVGLGWNINSGAVNRGMRGLPDDFNGEEIKKEINIQDFKAWGVGIGAGVELAGLSDFAGLNISGGMGITSSNYKGMGIEFYFEPTLSLAMGDKMAGSLTAGLGLKASTTDGTSIYPHVGVSGQYKTMRSTASVGYNLGASYNSREGLVAVTARANFSASRGKFQQKGTTGYTRNNNTRWYYRGKGVGMGLGFSVSVPVSSQGFLPQMSCNKQSQSYSLDFKLGLNACVVAPYGYIRGYYSQNGNASSDVNLRGYGYLFSQNADQNSLHDFSRTRDGLMYEETPNLPMTNYSYDVFSASAQGMELAFRPYRNDVGVLHDNATTESSFGTAIGAELLVAPDANVGVNVNTTWSNGQSSRWDTDNDMGSKLAFTSTDADYEAVYFKVAGEKTPDDATFTNMIRGKNAARVQLQKMSETNWKASNILKEKSGSGNGVGSVAKKSSRAVRHQLVSYLTAQEAQYAAIEKTLKSYTLLNPGADPGNLLNSLSNPGEFKSTAYQSYTRNTTAANHTQHISELTVTNTSGGRFVYGLPVYNRFQREVMFNLSGSGTTHSNANKGLIDYTPTDASKSNTKGLDHFYEKNTVPDYASSFLLTSILSSDYVDRTGDGPSQDDYGDYTKFNYSRVGDYNWRLPYAAGKASFNQGFLSDKTDDKGSYVYGNRDFWLPHSIETKNYIAFFILDGSRRDALEASTEYGGKDASPRSQYFLKEIRLYAKKDFGSNPIRNAMNQMSVTPLKVVHFEYDYSLCPGVPNNQLTATQGVAQFESSGPSQGLPSNGKLTLKKIYFSNGSSKKSNLSPYRFTYCNGNYTTASDNPLYDPSSSDRWGAYQLNTGGNKNSIDFPYTRQNKAQADVNARAWSLTEIQTPTGSKINVTYEADDYAFVQDVGASQMYNVLGFSASASQAPGSLLTDQGYLHLDLSTAADAGVPTDASNPSDLIKTRFLADMEKVYIRACVDLGDGQYEFVPLYADIESVHTNLVSTYTYGGTTYFNAIIKLKALGINDDGSHQKINPIRKAAFQLGRMYLPGVVFPGSQPNGQDDEQILKGLVTMFQDMSSLFSGINRALYNRGVANYFDPARSVARLRNANGKKIGGGSRVKKIEMDDGWNAMSGEASSVYGQEYSYMTDQSGRQISSGVASYEPMHGNDENALRKPVEFSIKRVMAPNDEYFQEEPLGEQFYPDALVGYSKVSIKNLDRSAQNVTKHATGRTEYEFYTAKDFPVSAEATSMQKQPVKPQLFHDLLDFGRVTKLYMSQGFVVRTNDMHGRPKSQKSFAEGADKPYSGVVYHYKTKANAPKVLDNTVNVIGRSNAVSAKTIGETIDFVSDSRSAVNTTWGAGASVNVNLAFCTLYVPLVFVWPSFTQEEREFYSMSTTKVVHQYGLIDYMEAFENNSTVETRNLLYDEGTGDILLTSTVNNYDDPVYKLAYPAYWAYDGMGPAYLNAQIQVSGSGALYNASTGAIGGSYFTPGDEVLVNSPSLGWIKAWVVQDKANGTTNYLVRSDGSKLTTSDSPLLVNLKILRSGRRNLLGSFMSSLNSLQNPVVNNKIDVNANSKVLSSAATEFSEERKLSFGKNYTTPACTTVYDVAAFTALCDLIKAMFDPSLSPAYAMPTVYYPNFYNMPSTPYAPNLTAAPLPSYVNIWKTPSFPKNPPTLFDGVGAGFFVQCNSQIQWATQVFQNYSSIFNPNYSPTSTCPITLVLLRQKGTFPLADYLSIYFYSNPTSQSISDLQIQISIPANSATNFRWLDVSRVADFRPPEVCNGETSPAYFKCYDEWNNFIADAKVEYSPAYSRTTISGGQVFQCGKKLSDIVNPYYENLRGNWYTKHEYSYLAEQSSGSSVRTDGSLNGFKPFYDQKTSSSWLPVYSSSRSWDYNASKPFDNWSKVNTNEVVDQYGRVVQSRDALQRPSGTIYGYNRTLAVASAVNSPASQMAFDGFEDYDYLGDDCSAMTGNNNAGSIGHGNFLPQGRSYLFPRSTYAHSGRYSMKLSPGSQMGANKITMSRALNTPAPAAGSDNVPYTLKERDNAQLFGPYHSSAQAQKFVTSVWVRELEPWQVASQSLGQVILTSPVKNDYGSNASINVSLSNNPGVSLISGTVKKSGIINGWQKLEYEFTVPANQAAGTSINIDLCNASFTRSYLFDDFRVHPFNASMKTMVYDSFTLRLMAEQDERNFSTYYEYDAEGVAVRSNKETENGIYTLKETRNGLKK